MGSLLHAAVLTRAVLRPRACRSLRRQRAADMLQDWRWDTVPVSALLKRGARSGVLRGNRACVRAQVRRALTK